MNLEYLRTLYDYSAWANEHILKTTAQLTQDQFLQRVGAGLGPIRDILVHTMSAQWMWLSRWQGVSPRAMLSANDFPDLEAVRRRWNEIEQDTRAFVAGLDEQRLDGIVEYTRTEGTGSAHPLWQLMVHQVNHATQHRSEVAAMLTEFGHSPGDLDLIWYLERNKRA